MPPGLKNLAPSAKLSSSDTKATPEMLAKITDGEKESKEDNVIFLHRGTQYVQMDFGGERELFAVVIWHAFESWKVYHGVIVQAADDANFTQNVHTLFNNDAENACGRGVGTDREYWETFQGKLIDAKGVRARYLRCYSKGSTQNGLNEYTEVEVYRPGGRHPSHGPRSTSLTPVGSRVAEQRLPRPARSTRPLFEVYGGHPRPGPLHRYNLGGMGRSLRPEPLN